MTDAFSAAMTTLFADPNLSVDAVVWPEAASVLSGWDSLSGQDSLALGEAGEGVAVRAILSTPDQTADALGLGVVQSAPAIEIRIAEAPALTENDVIQVGDVFYTLAEPPQQDALGVVWRAPLRPGKRVSHDAA